MPRLADMAVRGGKAYFLRAGEVFLASDSGGRWAAERIGGQVGGTQIAATDAFVCVDGGAPGRTGKLSRDDAHWEPLYFPQEGESQSLDADGHWLYAAFRYGGAYSQGKFYVSEDSGKSWEPLPKDFYGGSPDNAYGSFKVLDSALVAVYQGGKSVYQIHVSDDLGATWHYPLRENFRGFIVAGNRQRIFAADPNSGNFLSTADTGRSWHTVDGPRDPEPIQSLALAKDSMCVTVRHGMAGEALCSTDRGGRWGIPAWSSDFLHPLIMDGRGGFFFYDGSFPHGRLPAGFDTTLANPLILADWSSMFAVAKSDSTTWVGFTAGSHTEVARRKTGEDRVKLLGTGLPRIRSSAMVEYRGSLILASDSGVYRMGDDDTSWAPANPASPALLGSLASDGQRLFGVRDGKVAASPDRGATWENLAAQPGAVVSTVAAWGDTLYAGTSEGVWIASVSGMPIPESLSRGRGDRPISTASRIIWKSRGPTLFSRKGKPPGYGADGKLRR